jgi:predicted TIM-barrel enzyme
MPTSPRRRARLGPALAALATLITQLSPALPAQNGDIAGQVQPPLPAHVVVPPAPVLDPDEALAVFEVPDGVRVELVAAEPLVNDPVMATFDLEGRLWVVEMTAYMPNANDPLKDMRTVLERLFAMGVPSASNIGPSISYVDKDSQIFKVLNSAGITLDNEIAMLKLCRELGMISVGLAFDMEDSVRLVEEARPHIFCFHAGTTKGGLKGYDSGETIEQTAARTEEVCQKLRAVDPDVLLVGHGAALETPEDAQVILDNTSCDGFWTGSSTERIPIEQAVYATAKRFGDLRYGAVGEPS